MWPNLEREMDAFKRHCYGERYRTFRDDLRNNRKISKEKRLEFFEIENSFMYLIAYMIGRFENDGWGKGGVFQHLLTSHMLRLLTDMKVSLKEHWNLADDTTEQWVHTSQGNLYRSSETLISAFHPPTQKDYAMWGSDFWDDCYILLSLLKVRKELREINSQQAAEFNSHYKESLNWLRQQVASEFKTVSDTAEWFGPGVHAAAIELFDYLHRAGEIKDGEEQLEAVVRNVLPLVKEAVGGKGGAEWETRFAWHAGQLIVAWKEKRKGRRNPNGYRALLALDPFMEKFYQKLKERQARNGSWSPGKDPVNTNYNTVRGLAACYVMERDTEDGLVTSREIERAHNYLLNETHQAYPLRSDDKSCVNAIEAFQKLFEFTIPNIHFHLLVSLSYRLHCLGLEKVVISPPKQNERQLLKSVRRVAKEKLEDEGQLSIEALGVNGRLYDYLSKKPQFLGEFNKTDQQQICDDLLCFLSSTMTEVRSSSARKLIRELWSREGLLNFLPLINHLSDLEQERAFYAFYRDHLNHEVLLFLFGAYIYYKNKNFRESINAEIEKTYKHYSADLPDSFEKEFLFRWKLVATFHDVGYLFEVDPSDREYPTAAKKQKEKNRLLAQSFGVMERLRSDYLQEYFKQFAEEAGVKGIESAVAAIEKKLKPYTPRIREARNLFDLETVSKTGDAFDMMDTMLNLNEGTGRVPRGLIKDYFKLCEHTASGKRSEFYDHGIMSALMLLKVADIQLFYLDQLNKLKFTEMRSHPELLNLLMKRKTTSDDLMERLHIRFSHVAGAIALHNIYPGLYTQEQCREFDTKKKDGSPKVLERAFYPPSDAKDGYGISLDENPLAYLTALADVLQDWDRHSFRRTPYERDDKTPISSSEVLINCENDKIVVTPLSELASKRYMINMEGMREFILNCDAHVKLSPLKGASSGQGCPILRPSAS